MATSRCSIAVLALWCLACSPPSANEPHAAAAEVAPITRQEIEHVLPKRDFVGPMPARFEWTAVAGAVEYTLTVENEVDMKMFDGRTRETWLELPKGSTLDPGTYFWRVSGVSDGRRVADSGRAAFVVTSDPKR